MSSKIRFSAIFLLVPLCVMPPAVALAQVNSGPDMVHRELDKLGELFSFAPESPLMEFWQQLKISVAPIDVNQKPTFAGSADIGLGLKYRYTVQPAFIKSFQQRIDQYQLEISPEDQILKRLGVEVGAHVSAEVSFSRLFEDKMTAVKALPVPPHEFPWSAEMAVKNLRPGDVARIEFQTGASIGPQGTLNANELTQAEGSASVSRSAQLVIDIYRMKDKLFRMRIVAVRHQMDGDLEITANPILLIDQGAGFASTLLKNIFNFKLLSIGTSTNITEHYPVTTYMVDYVFDLEKPEAIKAFKDTMAEAYNIKTFNFLNFQTSPNTLDSRVLSLIKEPEALVKKYAQTPMDNRAIYRVFKGATVTNYHSFFLESQLSFLVPVYEKRIDAMNSVAQIRGFDHNDQPVDLVYVSRSTLHNFQGLVSKWQTLENNNVDALFTAKPNLVDQRVIPQQLSDVVVSKELNDKNFSKRQFERSRTYALLTVPSLAPLLPNIDFNQVSKITNGFYRYKLVIHPEALSVMTKVSANELESRLRKLISADPFAIEINSMFPANREHSNQVSTDPKVKLQRDISEVVSRFSVILGAPGQPDASTDEKFRAYTELREIDLFEELGPALMISLIPHEKIPEVIFLRFTIGGQSLHTQTMEYGKADTSEIYNSFHYMQSLINSRTFDLRLQVNSTNGNDSVTSPNAIKNCDYCGSSFN